MTDRRPRGMPAEHPKNGSSELNDLVAEYLDRLNSGESLDPFVILSEHPDVGSELVEKLEAFIDLTADTNDGRPLGTLGDYELRRQIGRGGMGVVYEAWQNSMDRVVALKVLPPGIAADSKAFHRFMREAKTAGQLNHQNVVAVYSTGVEEGTPWYSMEYVEGETLAQVLAKLREAEEDADTVFGHKDRAGYFETLARCFADVADGLQHAHSKGVVHRDIKPSNLILDSEGRLRILDFGLARLEGQESLTISGDVVGTPLYMSPEQARRRKIPIDHRTDVYSLGATMYEALCGRPPFRGKNHADTLSQVIERDPVEPRKVNPRIPKDLETIVLKGLRKDAADRYGTAEALAQDLRRFVRGDPIEARPRSKWERVAAGLRRRRAHVLTTGSILLLLLLVGWFAFASQRADLETRRSQYPHAVRDAVMKLSSGLYVFDPLVLHKLPSIGLLEIQSVTPFGWTELRSMFEDEAFRPVREAADELRALIDGLPDKKDAHFHLARAYYLLGRQQDALEELRQTLRIDSGFTPARVLLDEWGQGNGATVARESGTDDSNRLLDGDPDGWRQLWCSAFEAVRQRNWHAVVETHDKLLDQFSAGTEPYIAFRMEALMARGAAHLKLESYELAREDFAAVARGLAPVSIQAHLLLAKAYHLDGKPELADQHLRRLLESDSQAREAAVLSIVELYVSLEEYPDALLWATQAPGALRERLTTFLLLRYGEWKKAVESGREAVEASPQDITANMLLASALKNVISNNSLGEASLASELLRVAKRCVKLAPDNPDAEFLFKTAREIAAARSLPGSEAEETTVDDFTFDPDVTDCAPLCWQSPPCCRGEFTPAADGSGLDVVDAAGWDAFLVTERVFTDDVAIRVRGCFNGDLLPEAYIAVAIHWDWQRGGLYYATCRPTGALSLRKFVRGGGSENDPIQRGHVEIDPTSDLEIELRSTGGRVELRVWQPDKGEQRPEEPIAALEDNENSYSWGAVGFGGISRDGPPLRIRSVTLYR